MIVMSLARAGRHLQSDGSVTAARPRTDQVRIASARSPVVLTALAVPDAAPPAPPDPASPGVAPSPAAPPGAPPAPSPPRAYADAPISPGPLAAAVPVAEPPAP